ncbi:MAG: glycine cleavage system aminomethyltransferase GcvT [Acidobacteriota bacterium]
MTSTLVARKTSLYSIHRSLKARMTEFGGWEMPVEYSGIVQEHLAVRQAAGLFDISHMGEILVEGPESLQLVQKVTCNDASRLNEGQAQYSALLYPEGTFVDDILVHRLGPQRFLLCVNAANTEKDFQWICKQNDIGATLRDVSHEYAQLAVQGPQALAIVQQLTSVPLARLRYYWFAHGPVAGVDSIIARTGYTGEDGFELYFAPEYAERLWESLTRTGQPLGLLPAGLGARNTLRLEAKMALYGHEISESTTPWEADLAWIVKMDKGDFVGRAALTQQQSEGPKRKLVGFEMTGKGIARDGYPVVAEGKQVGQVTSGSPAPFLKKNIGLAYVPAGLAQVNQPLEIQVRANLVSAKVVPTPFYRRTRT